MFVRRHSDYLRFVPWDEQRSQFITRYLFAALGLAYFNLGDPVTRDYEHLVAVNIVHLVYFALTTAFLVHAWRHTLSPLRLRLAMWTDLIAVSCAVMVDANAMSPAYLVYLVIILGNGMRYGMRMFAEAALGSLGLGVIVLSLRFNDYVSTLSVATVFFIMFIAIIVAYSYSLMANVDRARRELELASSSDLLTGLLNRRGLYEHIETLFRSSKVSDCRAAILFADLDGFKSVNDVHGHQMGDRVLKEVASCIASCIREDDIAARFGGDEFVVIMPDTDADQAGAVARRLRESVSRWSQEHQIALSISIGMGEIPGHGQDFHSVLERVDHAMYRSKLASAKGGIQRTNGMLEG